MYFKLTFENVRKSYKDYGVYFLTLMLAVCIFYSFNAISSQKALTALQEGNVEIIQAMKEMMGYTSIFVAVILSALMLYANNFFIKRRHVEFGIYMTLGMGKSKISKMLMMETLLIGSMSLITGLAFGIGVSQGLSALTISLFDMPLETYRFSVSCEAILKTILYFAFMYGVVLMLNTIVISRYSIIDLIGAQKKNETEILRPFGHSLIVLALSATMLTGAYWIVLKIGLKPNHLGFISAILLGLIGTGSFFYGFASVLFHLVKGKNNLYYKKLNMFIARQLTHKLNTNFLSMTMICLMLFVTITLLSTGIGIKSAFESGLKERTAFDASAKMYLPASEGPQSIEIALRNAGLVISAEDQVAYYTIYDLGLPLASLFNYALKLDNGDIDPNWIGRVGVIQLSEYNQIRALRHETPIALKQDEVLLIGNTDAIVTPINEALGAAGGIVYKGKVLSVKNQSIFKETIETDSYAILPPTVVVNDLLVNGLKAIETNVNIQFSKSHQELSMKDFGSLLDAYKNGKIDYNKAGFVMGATKNSVYTESRGMATILLYIGIYMGLVFLLTSMAVLGLQQLSEASDSMARYKTLKCIGASEAMINRTILLQMLLYFTLPLGIALIHSGVSITVISNYLEVIEQVNLHQSILPTLVLLAAVYSSFFGTTYSSYINFVKRNL